jgi:hypothetical protein
VVVVDESAVVEVRSGCGGVRCGKSSGEVRCGGKSSGGVSKGGVRCGKGGVHCAKCPTSTSHRRKSRRTRVPRVGGAVVVRETTGCRSAKI